MTTLTFAQLREQNLPRCRRWHPDGTPPWTYDDWLLALGGEVGEALNVVKKLNRDRDGLAGNTRSRDELIADLAGELADVVIYLDICLGREGELPLGSTDFANLREVRRGGDSPLLLGSTPSQQGNLMLLAVSRIATPPYRHEALMEAIDRLADHFAIDLGAAVVAKFNATSEKFGFPERLADA